MKNSELITPPELEEVIDERSGIWREFDISRKHASELGELASKLRVKLGQATGDFAALAGGNTPPVELTMALRKLEAELKNIRQAQSEIEACESEIKSQEGMIVAGVVIAVIVIIVIIAVLAS